MYSFNKTVEQIDYEGTFPTVQIEYHDRTLPVNIRLKAASPFDPYDERTSATPGLYLTFEVTNTTNSKIDVALAGKLMNITAPTGRRSHVYEREGCTTIVMENDLQNRANDGSIALSVDGDDISYICGEYRSYMNEYVASGALGVSEESFLFDLRRQGHLPNTHQSTLPSAQDIHRLASTRSILERLSQVGITGCEEYLLANWQRLNAGEWGDSALCSSFTLQAGETRRVCFILSWYFPNLYSAADHRVGHVYENWFAGALDVNTFLRERRASILSQVYRLQRNLYHSSFPEVFADAVSTNLATLVKSSWWAQNGDFGIWEGLGSCGFHTTDITYHGSLGLISLFPNLQKQQMRMGARFQRDDGRVHHFFTPDFTSVDDGFDRVDMNPQFVLLVCRDYMATGDLDYVKELWPNILKATNSIEALDTDGDGLPDQETKRNTYDTWNFSGTSTYISVLWLAALRAAAYLVDTLHDQNQAMHWRQLEAKGADTVNHTLWNGRYYNLWTHEGRQDECCMTDQLDGEYFSRLIGLGGILPDDRVHTTLDSVYQYNYTLENGLINAGYPEGTCPTLYTFRNCRGDANWTGIEYMMAAFYLLEGQYERGLQLVETVQERHLRAGELWNHAECGDHYHRPLSGWALMQALTGVSHRESEHMLILRKPAVPGYGPWFGSTGYGQTKIDAGHRIVTCIQGSLLLQKLQIQGHIREIYVNQNRISFKTSPLQDFTEITFSPLQLTAGDLLEILL